MNNPLTANQLEFLSVLYVERHLSKTCNKLGITQPTGSRFLSSLREIFKDDLFIKSGSGMVPTEKCVRLMPEIENNLSNLNFLVRDEVFNPKTLRKTFRLGLVDNAFFSILMPLLGRIKEQAPHVNFCIPEIRFTDLFQSLVDDEVDLAIYPYKGGKLPLNIHHLDLFEEHFVYVTRKGHPLESVAEDDINYYVNLYPKVRIGSKKKFVFDDPSDSESSVSADGDYLKSPFFISSVFFCLDSDAVVVVPKRTALILSKWLPIRIILTHHLEEAPFYPSLYWHDSKNNDPANQWIRSILIAEAGKVYSC